MLEQSVYAFQWALENFCKEDDSVVIYHVHDSAIAPGSTLGTGVHPNISLLQNCLFLLHIAHSCMLLLWKDQLVNFGVVVGLGLPDSLSIQIRLTFDMKRWC